MEEGGGGEVEEGGGERGEEGGEQVNKEGGEDTEREKGGRGGRGRSRGSHFCDLEVDYWMRPEVISMKNR